MRYDPDEVRARFKSLDAPEAADARCRARSSTSAPTANIRVTAQPGKYVASAQFRDLDDPTRQVEQSGSTSDRACELLRVAELDGLGAAVAWLDLNGAQYVMVEAPPPRTEREPLGVDNRLAAGP